MQSILSMHAEENIAQGRHCSRTKDRRPKTKIPKNKDQRPMTKVDEIFNPEIAILGV